MPPGPLRIEERCNRTAGKGEIDPMNSCVRTICSWRLRSRALELGARTLVMGVVNITPDSFSDGGLCLETEAAIAHGIRLLDEGADILDLGAESTRPGSRAGGDAPAVSAEE